MPTDIRNVFSQLPTPDKALIPARLIHEHTIDARNAYAHSAPDGVLLMSCNESVHRLTGFLLTVLGHSDTNGEIAFIAEAIERIARGSSTKKAQLERWLSEISRGRG